MLNKKEATMQLDSGAQVSIMNDEYLINSKPNAERTHISKILDEHGSLRVQ